MAIDEGKLHEFLGRFVTDLGAVVAAGNVVIGHQLGLYRALASGPATGRCSARTVRRSGRFTLARPLGRRGSHGRSAAAGRLPARAATSRGNYADTPRRAS